MSTNKNYPEIHLVTSFAILLMVMVNMVTIMIIMMKMIMTMIVMLMTMITMLFIVIAFTFLKPVVPNCSGRIVFYGFF